MSLNMFIIKTLLRILVVLNRHYIFPGDGTTLNEIMWDVQKVHDQLQAAE